jgi:hypothetical protein
MHNNTDCEDCRITPLELVKTVHYTACRKPWECSLPHPPQENDPGYQYERDNLTNVTTCGLLFKKWFEARREVETLLEKNCSNYTTPAINGEYHPEYFLGYCVGPGDYIPMTPPPASVDMNAIYYLFEAEKILLLPNDN